MTFWKQPPITALCALRFVCTCCTVNLRFNSMGNIWVSSSSRDGKWSIRIAWSLSWGNSRLSSNAASCVLTGPCTCSPLPPRWHDTTSQPALLSVKLLNCWSPILEVEDTSGVGDPENITFILQRPPSHHNPILQNEQDRGQFVYRHQFEIGFGEWPQSSLEVKGRGRGDGGDVAADGNKQPEPGSKAIKGCTGHSQRGRPMTPTRAIWRLPCNVLNCTSSFCWTAIKTALGKASQWYRSPGESEMNDRQSNSEASVSHLPQHRLPAVRR